MAQHVTWASAARVLFGLVAAAGPVTMVAADGGVRSTPAATLTVLLTTAPQLSPSARAELVVEATALWDRAGVRLLWTAGGDAGGAGISTLRVLVIPRPATHPESVDKFVLGELVRFGPGALAIASIERAQQLVAASRPPGIAPISLREDRVGLVLGRAVAHEIGHYLLNTRTHAATGLMRAAYDIRELVDPRSSAFDMDDGSKAWLQDRMDRQLPLGPAAD